eukprot:GILJ01007057.1.p1 GENE.GILJ01007057.1~~GILJ01007057.1.p1  ORF type:complete len:567 (-),score=95.36 GILJ01007057.1:268-1968(-)
MSQGNGIIAVRREDKNKWERRAPLTPEQVKKLTEQGVKIIVQPSTRRCFANVEYERAGAVIQEDLSEAGTILAVKEVPMNLLIANRTYVMFSHTIKAQPANMPLLDKMLELNIRLIDYECITEPRPRGKENDENYKGKRLVAFGRFAGIAGMIDYLRGMGERLLSMGYSTPLLHVASAYMYQDVAAAKEAITKIGNEVRDKGLPEALCPFVVAFTGTGNVTQGALEMFKLLPHEMVEAKDLPALMANPNKNCNVFYGVIVTCKDMVKPKDPEAEFNREQYYSEPQLYEPIFHETVLPHISVLIHCMYWDRKFPRLVSCDQMEELSRSNRSRLLGVCDITCDFEGSVEFLKKFTTIEKPFYIYDPTTREVNDDLEVPGILYMAIDHLPAELPRDASNHFGTCLMPFLPKLATSDGSREWEDMTDLPDELRFACILANGKLTPNFRYIQRLREVGQREQKQQKTQFNAEVLRRTASFCSVTIRGHLFDSGLINRCLNILEEQQAKFRMLDWEIGQTTDQTSSVVIQLISADPSTLRNILKNLAALASEVGGAVQEIASGPSMSSLISA